MLVDSGSFYSESSQSTDDSGALSRASPLTGSKRYTKDNAVARKTIQEEAEERRDRERARAVCIGVTKVIPITDIETDKESYPERGPATPAARALMSSQPVVIRSRKQSNLSPPVAPIRYRNEWERSTNAPGSGRGGEGCKARRVDVQ